MPLFHGPHTIVHHRAHPAPEARRFEKMSLWTARAAGCRWGFRLAVLAILGWAATGPYVGYQEWWTTTFGVVISSVTFLLVFLIQNVQNRESKAIHLKLDELIYSAKNARNELIHIEHLTEEQLDLLALRYSRLASVHQAARLRRERMKTASEANEE